MNISVHFVAAAGLLESWIGVMVLVLIPASVRASNGRLKVGCGIPKVPEGDGVKKSFISTKGC